jgi:hypothetical protein
VERALAKATLSKRNLRDRTHSQARVAELADAGDSKSPSLRGVRVQFPPRAQYLNSARAFGPRKALGI